jgi:hypothetical protein
MEGFLHFLKIGTPTNLTNYDGSGMLYWEKIRRSQAQGCEVHRRMTAPGKLFGPGKTSGRLHWLLPKKAQGERTASKLEAVGEKKEYPTWMNKE